MTPDQQRITEQAARSAITRLWDALVPLRSVNSFLQTGAHPDDETSRLLARLAKGDGVRIAYACGVRGEGGQNDIGSELRNSLGVLRSREMEAAAEVLDMELYWLNEAYDGAIFDFGFSKSATETFEIWGKERTVERLVRVIRTTRPDAMAPTFLDVGGQHGHHRAITVATLEAFRLAGDPAAFPEHKAAGLAPWQPKKLYLPAWSGGGGSYDDETPPPNATLSIDVGGFDPVHGATYAQMAQWSRAYHRTQGMGRWSAAGPDSVPLHRLECTLDVPVEEGGLFDGLPNTLEDLAGIAGDGVVGPALLVALAGIADAFAAFPDNRAVADGVHRALAAVRQARAGLDALPGPVADDLGHRLAVKERQLSHASTCACLVVGTLALETYELAGGVPTTATLSVYNGGPVGLQDVSLDVVVADGWQATGKEGAAAALATGERVTTTSEVAAAANAEAFFPYRFGGADTVADDPVRGRVGYTVGDVRVETTVGTDDVVAVLPPVSYVAMPDRVVVNLNRPGRDIALDVRAVSTTDQAVQQRVTLQVPNGWQATPGAHEVALAGRGQAAAANFHLTLPAALGVGRTVVGLDVDGGPGQHVEAMARPHIRKTYRVTPVEIQVQALDVTLPAVRVGYVGAKVDRVDHWLDHLGVSVEPLDAAVLATGDLGAYDTIIVGVYAYGMRADLSAARGRLRDYVEAGGNLVTLYHRPWDNWDPELTPPRYLKVGQPSLRWRITDPNAAVSVLAPDHPLLHTPNEIGAADWAGWVKERGLYFAADWADDYMPLLAMSDPGEAPLNGALLAADIGRGRHVHAALILHYQMEFLVPGAFRLLANLIAPRG